jgi:hypothetical protein
MKTIILPGDFYSPKKPDPQFEQEYNSAKKFGNVVLFSHEEFLENEILEKLPKSSYLGEKIFYYGWMMNTDHYKRFYTTVYDKGYQLPNDLRQYTGYHHFHRWYSLIEGLTPESIMIESEEIRPILEKALKFQRKIKSPLIIKDTVKSLKHDWNTACFIPKDSDPFAMAKVIGTFLEIKKSYNDLKLPVVLRQFEDLVPVGVHPKSGMPISHEYRTYIYRGEVIFQAPYWEATYEKDQEPPTEFIQNIIDKLGGTASGLFTIDTALKKDGQWTCIEIGDGQVSSLPENADKDAFFSKLLG